jgi:hypothetical protein
MLRGYVPKHPKQSTASQPILLFRTLYIGGNPDGQVYHGIFLRECPLSLPIRVPEDPRDHLRRGLPDRLLHINGLFRSACGALTRRRVGKGRLPIQPSKKQPLQTLISTCFRSRRQSPKISPLLFSAVLGILVQPQWTKKLGTRGGVRFGQGDHDASFADATFSAHCEDDALGRFRHCSPPVASVNGSFSRKTKRAGFRAGQAILS